MEMTLLDLSPYYLQEARKNMRYWADKCAPGKDLGGADGTGTTYLQAPAEAISQPDSSFDAVCAHARCQQSLLVVLPRRARGSIQCLCCGWPEGGVRVQVTCVYLFHELPPEVRRKAAAEMARVLRPGGLLVITDSIQLGDRSRLDENLGRFGDLNEPYYRSYIQEDFGERLSLAFTSSEVAESLNRVGCIMRF
jgi:ubiquinone/menaquinone biosynthesis C-methylase UbiE